MKVGDYAYIKGISRDYGIGKITKLDSGYSNSGELIDIQFKHSKHSVPKKDTVSSPNIIDLIVVGDFVNGKEIEQIINNELYFETSDMASKISFKENDIKSIVTKEQFESMEYKIGGKNE
ncbi:MAG: hypothetical protein IJ690_01980 [Clostridia bacterium]|nr:hypothetical protein [Clostridia bacterium]MBR1653710.1 hypothetical protein [Clostridia bacterium]